MQQNFSEQHYDMATQFLRKIWSKNHIHFGLWYKNTERLEDALENSIKEIINYLEIKSGDTILDAGCGVGGSCIYIAKNCNAVQVVGITLSNVQIEIAKKTSHDIENIQFYYKDYNNTGFDDGTFTKIFAIESIIYAEKKEDFIKEAYRLLKKGGKLVVMDAFSTNLDINNEYYQLYKDWLDHWHVPPLLSIEQFKMKLEEYSFHNISCYDKTPQIKKSAIIMHDGVKEILELINSQKDKGSIPEAAYNHLLAAYKQKECLDKNFINYAVFEAEK